MTGVVKFIVDFFVKCWGRFQFFSYFCILILHLEIKILKTNLLLRNHVHKREGRGCAKHDGWRQQGTALALLWFVQLGR